MTDPEFLDELEHRAQQGALVVLTTEEVNRMERLNAQPSVAFMWQAKNSWSITAASLLNHVEHARRHATKHIQQVLTK